MAFYSRQAHLDTIVFVHGFLRGHYIDTWAQFPALLHTDPDLPELDILMWGYRTGVIRGYDVIHESERLITDICALIRSDNALYLVGHSMGGLVILKGLRDQMFGGWAESHPCINVRLVSLFASPLTGSWMVGVIRHTVGIPRVLNKHIRNLSRSDFCDQLILDVFDRIYRPKVEDRSARRIPIRMNVGMRDAVVDKADRDAALARFRDPRPYTLDEGHASIKEPSNHLDVRYRLFQNDLQDGLADSLYELSGRYYNANTPNERVEAWQEIQRRYRTLAEQRVQEMLPELAQERAIEDSLRLAAADSLALHRPPFETINRVVMVLASRVRR